MAPSSTILLLLKWNWRDFKLDNLLSAEKIDIAPSSGILLSSSSNFNEVKLLNWLNIYERDSISKILKLLFDKSSSKDDIS